MIVVSNTTPLRYLIAIRQDHVLAGLFTKIHIPLSVFEELTHLRTPELVRQRVSSVPPWLEVHRIALPEPSLLQRRVHRGERDAIALAESRTAELLLIDEKDGRIAAANRGFQLTGTLGILKTANSLGLIKDFPKVVADLLESGFHLKPALLEEMLNRNSSA